MEPFELVNHAVALVSPHLPRAAEAASDAHTDGAAQALYRAIEQAVQAQGQPEALDAFVAHPADNAEIKRILRQAVRHDPATASALESRVLALAAATRSTGAPQTTSTTGNAVPYGPRASIANDLVGDKTGHGVFPSAAAGGLARSAVASRPAAASRPTATVRVAVVGGFALIGIVVLVSALINFAGSVGGLGGNATCRDYLASTDVQQKVAVMKRLYLAQNKTNAAADPFIIQNTEYFCGQRPDMKLSQLANTVRDH